MANSVPVFERLVGLETEYAVRFRPADSSTPVPSKFQLYQSLLSALRMRVLTVPARHFKEGVFTACGGAVWFEAVRPAAGDGMIEGSTPECRGARQVVCYQRAQDRLLSESASAASGGGQYSLIKNDRDSDNNVYGAQENYEATIASGWQLACWRGGLVLLLPALLLTWLNMLLLFVVLLGYLALAGLFYLPARLYARNPKRLAVVLFGQDLVEGKETGSPMPVWMELVMQWVVRLITAPLAVGIFVLAWATAFRRIRRQLLPFLVSRSLIGGSGMIDHEGRFLLADKAPAVNCVLGLGGFLRERPIFILASFFKALCVECRYSLADFRDLFARRQRLQLGLGDSNMAETAELLRIGSTLLVLDVIEAGELPKVPRLQRPIRALHDICRDPTLRASVPLTQGRATALELQRFYLAACRGFLQRRPEAPGEAHEIVRLWEEVLDELEAMQVTGRLPRDLIGSIDWVTKRFLLERAGGNASWQALKKIDIRYHELSPEGYFQRLSGIGIAPNVIAGEAIRRAMRTPPPNTPATTRGHYIREFAHGGQRLLVNWTSVVIGSGMRAKVVRLSDYGQKRAQTRTDHCPDDAPAA